MDKDDRIGPSIPQTSFGNQGLPEVQEQNIKAMAWHELAKQIIKNLHESNANPTIFKHYAKRIDRLLSIQQQAEKIGDVETLNKINAFAIHYLLKGAKFPLLHEQEKPRAHEQEKTQVHKKEKMVLQEQEIQVHEQEKLSLGSSFHLSLLDYGAFTKPSYYRSEPSSMGTLYEEVLKRQGYEPIFQQCQVIPAKSVKWKRLLKGCFPWMKMVQIPKEVPKIDTAQEMQIPLSKVAKEKGVDNDNFGLHLQKLKETYQSLTEDELKTFMFDLSPLLNGPERSSLAPEELSQRVAIINEVLKECNTQRRKASGGEEIFPKVFGMAKLDDGQMALLLFKEKVESTLPQQQASGSQAKQGAKSVDEAFKDDLIKMLNKGYRSDLPRLEQSFIERGLTLPQIVALTKQILPQKGVDTVESTSAPTKTSSFETISLAEKKEAIAKKLGILRQSAEQINSSQGNSRKDFIYFAILNDIFIQIGKEIIDKEDDLTNAFVYQSLDIVDRKLDKLIKKMETELPMEKLLSDVDLIFEEFILQLNFVSPANLKQTITERSQEGLGVPATGYACTSSMNAFSQLLPALFHSNKDSSLNIVYLENVYFETVEFLTSAKNFVVNSERVNGNTPIPNLDNKDAVFIDFYPNNAPMKDVTQRPIPELIPPASLMNRNKPLTLVIDTSAGIFYEDAVKDVIRQYQTAIEAGKLNIVVVNSLVKFAMCGVDKYQGGSITVYSDNHSPLNKLLAEYEEKEPLSPQAAAFFNLFLSNPRLILTYKNIINENTTRMYSQLMKVLNPKKSIGLTVVERPNEETPLIAIHFGKIIDQMVKSARKVQGATNPGVLKNALSPVMRDYIVYQARLHGLPLSKRSSFGFAHSNLSDTLSALRLTVGLESPQQLDAYANVLVEVNEELTDLNPDEMAGFSLLAKNHTAKVLSKAAEEALQRKPNNFKEMLGFMKDILQTK